MVNSRDRDIITRICSRVWNIGFCTFCFRMCVRHICIAMWNTFCFRMCVGHICIAMCVRHICRSHRCLYLFYVAWTFFDNKDDAHFCTPSRTHNTLPHPRSLLLIARLQIICSFRIVLTKIDFRSGPLRAFLLYVAWSFFRLQGWRTHLHVITNAQHTLRHHESTTYRVLTNNRHPLSLYQFRGWRFKSWQVKSVPSQAHHEGSLAPGQAHKERSLKD